MSEPSKDAIRLMKELVRISSAVQPNIDDSRTAAPEVAAAARELADYIASLEERVEELEGALEEVLNTHPNDPADAANTMAGIASNALADSEED